ncbi:flavodoxin [Streptococcus constellatus]|uniref:flavodoxin n=1 Tax=Streptococcus constellatus TaxID=76860 RepID=UPI0020A2B43A|nr:flavodoxin [Streptococcus constellatus]
MNISFMMVRMVMVLGLSNTFTDDWSAPTNFFAYWFFVIGHPIWWGRPPCLIQTVMESLDLAGKRVATLTTSGGSTYSEAQIVIDQMMKNSTQGRVLSSTTDAIKWLTDIDF